MVNPVQPFSLYPFHEFSFKSEDLAADQSLGLKAENSNFCGKPFKSSINFKIVLELTKRKAKTMFLNPIGPSNFKTILKVL